MRRSLDMCVYPRKTKTRAGSWSRCRLWGLKKGMCLWTKSRGRILREKYQALVAMLREGDEVYFTSLDRMGRDYDEIASEWERITKEIKAHIVVLDMPILDTREQKDLTGQLITDIVLKLLSYVAENERQKIRSRQAEGIALARAAGKYGGRKPVEVDKDVVESWFGKVKRKECSTKHAMTQMGLKASTYYKFCKELTERTGMWA